MEKKVFIADSNTYLIINNGARVLKDKYYEFAKYLSKNDINVITYNYSDMGISLKKMKESQSTVSKWGKEDFKSIIEYVLNLNNDAKIFVLGHSLGGQIIGLADNCTKISGIILVAAQTGIGNTGSFL